MEFKRGLIFGILILTLLISFVYAEYNFKKLDFTEQYQPSENIKGDLIMSFDKENANHKFEFVIKNKNNETITEIEKSLIETLKLNKVTYSCEPTNCSVSYSVSNPQLEKNVALAEDNYIGFFIQDENVEIQSLNFKIKGSGFPIGENACENPETKLDFLDDSKIERLYHDTTDNLCLATASDCYNSSVEGQEAILNAMPYCQVIKPRPTNKIKVAATVKYVDGFGETKSGDVVLSIYDAATKKEKKCSPGKITNTKYQTYECTIFDFLISKENMEYYVCISSDGTAKYKVKTENSAPVCGFWGSPPSNDYKADYSVYVREYSYAPFLTYTNINESTTLVENKTLITYLQEYINAKYKKDCSSGCIIPLRIIQDQNLNFKNLELVYKTSSGLKSTSSFYDLTAIHPSINAIENKIKLDNFASEGLKAPTGYDKYYFEIYFNKNRLAKEEFIVAQIPKVSSIYPLKAGLGISTEFSVDASSPTSNEIKKYNWDWGDGSSSETTTKKTSHKYSELGNYTIKVKVEDSQGLIGENSFEISVAYTSSLISQILEEKKDKLTEFKLSVSSEEKDLVYKVLEIEKIDSELSKIESDILKAQNDEDYELLVKKLNSLKIPYKLLYVGSSELKEYYVSDSSIDVSSLEILNDKQSNFIEDYNQAITEFNNNNISIKTKIMSRNVIYEDLTQKTILTYVEIKTEEKEMMNYNGEFYLVVGVAGNISVTGFMKPYKTDNNFMFFSASSPKFEVALTSEKALSSSELTIWESPDANYFKFKKPFNWGILIWIIIILAVLIGIYFLYKAFKKGKIKMKPKNQSTQQPIQQQKPVIQNKMVNQQIGMPLDLRNRRLKIRR